jgi:glycosyltransferase involved in cell wall biosynthesis
MAQQLTALIPCKNERRNLRACVESVRSVAGEILVADSGSTDGTQALARALGCRLIERDWRTAADFRNWAIPQCANPWVLAIDADERLTPELAREIEALLRGAPECDGYWVYRRNFFLGHEVRRCGWNRDRVLGLFRRDCCRFAPGRVHEQPLVATGKVGRLRGKYLHYSYWTLEQYLEKLDRYSGWAAQDLHAQGRRARLVDLGARPALSFVRDYLARGGFLEGKQGLVVSLLNSYAVLVKYAKLWALDRARPQPDPEARERAGLSLSAVA